MKTTTLLLLGIASFIFVGCDRTRDLPQHAGVVFAHVGSADPATGTSHVLDVTGQFAAGFDYGDASAADWDATINWNFLASNDIMDTYRLNWVFTPASGSSVSGTSDVAFDGTNQSITVVNDQLTITISSPDTKTGG